MVETDNVEFLEKMKQSIESMNQYHQIEILNILNKNMCKINENKSGVYVNLSFLSKETIHDLLQYIHYIRDQEDSLVTMEYQKAEFKNSFFVEKEDKDNSTVSYK
uniref:NET domain-containing protein n=1 Tax=viral metagenome TaxID=1070528 RepID=A0A6C0I5G6_9ZZZZ